MEANSTQCLRKNIKCFINQNLLEKSHIVPTIITEVAYPEILNGYEKMKFK